MKYTLFEIDSESLFLDKPETFASHLSSILNDNKIDKKSIAKIECWLSILNDEDYAICYNTFYAALPECFKNQYPAATLIAQAPLTSNNKTLIKVSLCNNKDNTIEHKVFQKHPYTVIRNQNESLILSGGIRYQAIDDTLRSVQGAYDFAEQLLDHEEMHFGQICHQWNYMPKIESPLTDPHTNWTNSQTITEIRNLYFDPSLFRHGYPMQNDIGLNSGGFITDFIAASKDGFPTAQIKGNAEDNNQLIYIPLLDEIHIKSCPSAEQSNTSITEQTDMAVQALQKLLKENNLLANPILEIKIFISKKSDFNTVHSILAETLEPESILVLQAQTANTKALIAIEAILKMKA